MIMNHANAHDGTLDPYVVLDIPNGFKFPAPVAKLIKAYNAAFDAWIAAEAEQIQATDDLTNAAELDKAALIAAVSAGEPDPGTAHQDKAQRACLYAEEAARQAATAVNKLVLDLREALPKHRAELITQACAAEREAIAERTQLLAQAHELVEKSTAVARTIGTRANWLLENLGENTEYRIAASAADIGWPAPYQVENTAALEALDKLEGIDHADPESAAS